MRSLILASLTALAILAPGLTRADALEDLHKSFMARYDEANARRDEQLKKLDNSYLGALERQLEKTKSGGKLDAVLPIVSEMEAIKTAKDPLPPLPDNASLELKQMRGKHADGREKILKSHAETLVALADKMDVVLKSQESELTKAGKIDDALAAKHMRETLTQDQGITAARDSIKNARQVGNARPALRLRRYGDNLEVLVFPDRSGKVTMDSPVQNVREETGGKKELGDTKAKVLGEFVGAKGYEADPFIAYHQVFDGKDAGNFTLTEIVPEFRHEEDNQKGLRLSMKSLVTNPHGSFGPILPPNTAKGSYRISARYFIPRSNRAITGFMFVHGIGGPIGGTKFEDAGKWVSGDVTGESSHATGTLLFYLCMNEGSKAADAKGDYVVLGELKVEQRKFAAYIQGKSGPDGRMTERFDDPLKQPLFISNGEFAEK